VLPLEQPNSRTVAIASSAATRFFVVTPTILHVWQVKTTTFKGRKRAYPE